MGTEYAGVPAGDRWWFVRHGRKSGPLTTAQLAALAAVGELAADDPVAADGGGVWHPAGQVPGLTFPGYPPTDPGSVANGAIATGTLESLRDDARDVELFIAEAIRVTARLHPLALAVGQFADALAAIPAAAGLPERADKLGRAIAGVDLVAVAAGRDELAAILGTGLRESAAELDRLVTVWPDAARYVHPWPDLRAAGDRAADRLNAAIRGHEADWAVVRDRLGRLIDGYPRYRALADRPGWLGGVLGFAAGAVGGTVGAAGYDLWAGWRDRSDAEFVAVYAAAVEDFVASGAAVAGAVEAAAEPVAVEFGAAVRDAWDRVAAGARAFAAGGGDPGPIVALMRSGGENPQDPDERAFVTVVLDALRARGVSPRSERNLRDMYLPPLPPPAAAPAPAPPPPAPEPAPPVAERPAVTGAGGGFGAVDAFAWAVGTGVACAIGMNGLGALLGGPVATATYGFAVVTGVVAGAVGGGSAAARGTAALPRVLGAVFCGPLLGAIGLFAVILAYAVVWSGMEWLSERTGLSGAGVLAAPLVAGPVLTVMAYVATVIAAGLVTKLNGDAYLDDPSFPEGAAAAGAAGLVAALVGIAARLTGSTDEPMDGAGGIVMALGAVGSLAATAWVAWSPRRPG